VNAPAILLCASFEAIAAGLKRFSGKHREFPHERSLFPYGFSPQEEAGIAAAAEGARRRAAVGLRMVQASSHRAP
jgi:hypothetical protein